MRAGDQFVVGQRLDVRDWDGAWLPGLVVVVDNFFGGESGAVVVAFVDRLGAEQRAHFILPFDFAKLALAGSHTEVSSAAEPSSAALVPLISAASPRVETGAAHDTWAATLVEGVEVDVRDFDGRWHAGAVIAAGDGTAAADATAAASPPLSSTVSMLTMLPGPTARVVRVAFGDSFGKQQVTTIYVDLFHDSGRLALAGSRSSAAAVAAAAAASASASSSAVATAVTRAPPLASGHAARSPEKMPPQATMADSGLAFDLALDASRRSSPARKSTAAHVHGFDLSVGAMVDCRDHDGWWYAATVLLCDQGPSNHDDPFATHVRLRFVDRFGFDQLLSLYLPFDIAKLAPLQTGAGGVGEN